MRSHEGPYKYQQHLRHLKLVMMDSDCYQLPSCAGQKLFRIWLPGNFNKSCFVTDNSYIEMHVFFFFPLVWFSFQMPLTFYSFGVFNSFLSCCLSRGVSFSSTSCLLIGTDLSVHSAYPVPFLITGPSGNFTLTYYFSKMSLQKLYFLAI